MLTRLTAQRHDYNLKLTRDELLSLCSPDFSEQSPIMEKMFLILHKEVNRLGGGE